MPPNDSPAAISGMPRDDYDKLKGWNSSLLKVALTKTPAHAYNSFLAPNRPPSKDSAAFRIGTLVHQALLEPEVWRRIFPCPSGSTTKAFAETAKACKENGQQIAQQSEYDLAAAMSAAVREHPALGTHFAPTPENIALNELTVIWPDMTTGQQCKARLDAVRITDDELLVLDLKTTADASATEFGKSAASYLYLLQAAFYADAIYYAASSLEKFLDLPAGRLTCKPISFEFIAIEKEAPHQIARYRLTADQAALGRRLYRRALDLVTKAADLDWWPGYDTGPAPLELPNWAWTQLETLASPSDS